MLRREIMGNHESKIYLNSTHLFYYIFLFTLAEFNLVSSTYNVYDFIYNTTIGLCH